jgi:hypothetical protein
MKAAIAAGAVAIGNPFAWADEDTSNSIARSRAQIFFCGGHGGVVTYDGKGGPLLKDGGPIDRLFILRTHAPLFELGGDHGLDITFGCVRMATGRLKGEVKPVTYRKEQAFHCVFDGNDQPDAIVLTGCVPELDIPSGTVLFSGTVQPSEMLWIRGDGVHKPTQLPYTALHKQFTLHPAIAERFNLTTPVKGVAVSGWNKDGGSPGLSEASKKFGKYAAAFRTQQHLGSLRIFVV